MGKAKKKKEPAPKPSYNMWQTVCYMFATAWQNGEKKVPVMCVLTAVLAVMTNLVELYLSPTILAAVEQRASFGRLTGTIGFFVGLSMLTSALTSYVNSNKGYGWITVRSIIINRINQKSCKTSYTNLGEERYQNLYNKCLDVTNDNREATERIWQTLTKLLQNTAGLVIYVALLSAVDIWILVLVLVTAVFGYVVHKQLNRYKYRHREEEAKILKNIHSMELQSRNYSLAKDIRIFGMKDWLAEVGRKALEAYRAFQGRLRTVYLWGKIADLLLAFLRNGMAYAYLIYLVLHEGLSVSEFLLYFSAVGGFSTWVNGILNNFSELHRQSLDISTVMEFLNYPEPFLFEEGEALIAEAEKAYEIRLENVSYRYPEAEKDTLSHIGLTLHPGEKLAVVGLNGAGKTTLIKLICGFLDPTEGRVLLNGEDIRKYNRRDYYTLFSAVFQDFSLLALSVAANVAQTEEKMDMDKVKLCLKKAGLTEKMEALQEQYETKLNRQIYPEGAELSGGETQRLMLARALYKDAPIILLDEPTAALDPIAEADMYQKYYEMTKGKASVYISHRLASTRFCDRIILLENNRIAEEGTHQELLEKGGSYAALFEMQSRYYKKGECCCET